MTTGKPRVKLSRLILLVVIASSTSRALTPEEKTLVDKARAQYYNLQASGFDSLTCNVVFDFNSIPFANLDDELKNSLKSSTLVLTIDSRGRTTVDKTLSATTPNAVTAQATQLLSVMQSLVSGVFQTWPTKGLTGPIPPFDRQINHVKTTSDGYVFDLNVPGAPVLITTDKAFITKSISSIGGMTIETTTYTPSEHGLIFAGTHALNKNTDGSEIEVEYSLSTQEIEGLAVPASVHLVVKPNIDARYSLESCKAKKSQVIKLQ